METKEFIEEVKKNINTQLDAIDLTPEEELKMSWVVLSYNEAKEILAELHQLTSKYTESVSKGEKLTKELEEVKARIPCKLEIRMNAYTPPNSVGRQVGFIEGAEWAIDKINGQ